MQADGLEATPLPERQRLAGFSIGGLYFGIFSAILVSGIKQAALETGRILGSQVEKA